MKLNYNLKTLLFLFVPALCVFGIEFLNYSYVKGALFIAYTPLIIAAAVEMCLLILSRFIKKNIPNIIYILLFFCIFGVSYFILPSLFLNFLVVLSLELIILGITKRYDVSSIIVIIVCFLLGQLNSYVIRFRGTAINWADLKAVNTAKNVFSNYDYSLTKDEIIILFLYFVLLIFILLVKNNGSNLKIGSRLVSSTIGVGIISLLLFTNVVQLIGIEESLFHKQPNGLILNQLLVFDRYIVKFPKDYSLENINKIASSIKKEDIDDTNTPQNIIVIMNEAFSDISFSGEIDIPNIKALREDTVSGTAYVSVFGGNTANSEYEFLTNNSMFFLNSSLVPYTLNIINENSPSIVKSLGNLGYETIAFHPWLKSGWNRETTYRNLGFDKQLYIEDFESWESYGDFPSDKWDYEQIINLHKNKSSDKLFLFNITIQNHSPNKDIVKSIEQCDRDIADLINYFSNIHENTMIVFFGDHQYMMDNDFYERHLKTSVTELSGELREEIYTVPFFIWCNYDIEEQENVKTSLNFLSTIMFDVANLPLNKYQVYLKDLYSEVPIIHANGIWDSNGVYYESCDGLPEEIKTKINNYKNIQYNSMIDTENLIEDFFEIPEKVS